MPTEPPSTLKEAARLLGEWKVSSLELTQAALERARMVQPVLNAFIEIEEDIALEQARLSDSTRARGAQIGPLHGIPLAHKDIFAQTKRVCGCGSKIRQRHIPKKSCDVIKKLERAGALSIGRLNMSEFAIGPTGHNAHYGRTINPFSPDRIAGGSSSGSGAAVGGGIVLGSLGSDTSGALRLPAACCGVAGIKPTFGRVSALGAMPVSNSLDCIGPMARTVEDAYFLLEAISADSTELSALHRTPALRPMPTTCKQMRVGVLQGSFARNLHPVIEDAMEETVRRLARVCRSVAAAPCPDIEHLPELTHIVASAEAASFHYDWMRTRPEDYGPQTRVRLAQGLAIPSPIYLKSLKLRGPLLARFLETAFASADVLVAPVMPILPPLASQVDAGDTANTADLINRMTAFTSPFSFLGLPVVTIPVDIAAETGVPVGIQVIARPWREDLAAGVAACVARETDFPLIADFQTSAS